MTADPSKPAPARPLQVLIADDNADAAESLGMLLQLEGHVVHIASDGLAALALAEQLRPQVAVLDVGMPGLNGHELAQRLRQEPWGQGMFILAVTGWGQQEDQRLALAAGFDRHFTKPMDPVALLDCLAAWQKDQQGPGRPAA
jgi:CheY-like chemotaxis protein